MQKVNTIRFPISLYIISILYIANASQKENLEYFGFSI